jgi:YesN/AraC family two-component response regulator
MKNHVLFVDDEKSILHAIERVFFYAHYDISVALSGDEGLGILQRKPADVIVSDMRMPGMDGIAFLEKTRAVCPDAIRMVLSAHVDINEIMRAVNDGHIWRYITKPWNENDLLLAVKNAVEFHEKSMETKRLIEEVKEKNRALADVNAILEDRVRQRTQQLEIRNELLNMLVENKPIEDIVNRSCDAISRQLNGKKAFVLAPSIIVEPDFPAETRHLAEAGRRSMSEKKNTFTEAAVCILLHQKETNLGVLVVENELHAGIASVTEALESIGTILSIALSQRKLLQDMPDLLNSINSIVGDPL